MTDALVTPRDAGKALGIGAETVRAIVRSGAWACIGAAAVQQEGSSTWHYTIPRAGFERMVNEGLPTHVEVHIHKHIDLERLGAAVMAAVTDAVKAA